MQIMKMLAGTALACCLAVPAPAASLEIPDYMQALAHRVEFLSHMARRCEWQLRMEGKAGAKDASCVEFVAKQTQLMQSVEDTAPQWQAMVQQALKSGPQRRQEQMIRFIDDFNRHLEVCVKTMAHLIFLEEPLSPLAGPLPPASSGRHD